MTDQRLFIAAIIINLLIGLVLYLSYRKDRTSLLNGTLVNLLLFSLSITIIIGGMLYEDSFLRKLMFLVLIIYLIVAFLGIYIIIIASFVNASMVLKRETRSLGNLLTLGLGIGLTVFWIVSNFNLKNLPLIVRYLINYMNILLVYFGFSFLNYIISSLAYGIIRPKADKDFIVVLGSGLIDGYKVSKLLGGRIDRAIDFYRKQKELGKSCKIILSGGQGPDEKLSEAQAMMDYALDKGIEKDDLILEGKSRNTLENLKFSKRIMDASDLEDYKSIFSTSNYHVFRAAIYAESLGFKIEGIGGKVAGYYIPNAIIREYIAILAIKKKSYLIKLSIISLIFILYIIFDIYALYFMG